MGRLEFRVFGAELGLVEIHRELMIAAARYRPAGLYV